MIYNIFYLLVQNSEEVRLKAEKTNLDYERKLVGMFFFNWSI